MPRRGRRDESPTQRGYGVWHAYIEILEGAVVEVGDHPAASTELVSALNDVAVYLFDLRLAAKVMYEIRDPRVRRPRAPLQSAQWLADRAARILPAPHRGRYIDEYRSELHDLAVAGASRWRQWHHALRLLDGAWLLRAELSAAPAKRARS